MNIHKTYRHQLLLLVGLLFFMSNPDISSQSPWPQQADQSYLQAGYYMIPQYNSLFQRSGEARELDFSITNRTIQFFGEYGIGPSGSVVVKAPFKILTRTQQETKLQSFGNIVAGLKQQLYKSPMPVTAHLNVSMPTGRYETSSGLRSGYEGWDINPLISTGKGWKRYYLQGYTGAHFRTNGYSTLLNAGFEGGYQPFSDFWSIFYMEWLHALRDGSREEPGPFTGLYVNNQEYLSWGIKLMKKISGKYGIIGGVSGSFSGHHVAHSPLLHIGIYRD